MGIYSASRRRPLGGLRAGSRIPGRRNWAAEPTGCPRRAAQQIPRNQVGKPRAARSLRPGGIEGRACAPAAFALFFKVVGGGKVWPPRRALSRTPALGRRRGRALFPPAQRIWSLLCHSLRPRTGRGLGTPSATGGEGEFGGTCLRRGSRASAGVGSIGRPARRRRGQIRPAAALGLLRNQAELPVSPWLWPHSSP